MDIIRVVVVLLFIWLASVPAPASAASRIVYVNISPKFKINWGVGSAVAFVDTYTGSDMRFGDCRKGYKCITFYKKELEGQSGLTEGVGTVYSPTNRTTIYLNSKRDYFSWWQKRRVVIHELGHAMGIMYHSEKCSYGVMYGKTFCRDGSLPPIKFTQRQKEILRDN